MSGASDARLRFSPAGGRNHTATRASSRLPPWVAGWSPATRPFAPPTATSRSSECRQSVRSTKSVESETCATGKATFLRPPSQSATTEKLPAASGDPYSSLSGGPGFGPRTSSSIWPVPAGIRCGAVHSGVRPGPTSATYTRVRTLFVPV
jgi:hypothetical protein